MRRRRFLALLPAALPATRDWGLSAARAGAATPSRHRDRAVPPATPTARRRPDGAQAVVLGTAQDAGVPQANCFAGHCARVRSGEAAPPLVACLGLLDEDARRRFLIDATPDLPAQLGALLEASASARAEVAGRTVPLHEHLHGILLTHAHIGHYLGLAHLGKEAAAPRALPVWASARMAAFLRSNAPWEALVRNGNIELRVLEPGTRVRLTPALEVTPFAVVHRPEYSDTLGFLVHGPRATLLYVPDADSWSGWETPFESLLEVADTALLDGSFYSPEELGHRLQAEVAHPPIVDTVARLGDLQGRPPVWFVHLNHTNPLWDPASPLHHELPAGFAVAATGQRFAL